MLRQGECPCDMPGLIEERKQIYACSASRHFITIDGEKTADYNCCTFEGDNYKNCLIYQKFLKNLKPDKREIKESKLALVS